MRKTIEQLTGLGIGCGVAIAFSAIVAIVIGYPIKWLWNWIMPNIFGLPEISFWLALGLAILISLLFGRIIKVNFKKR